MESRLEGDAQMKILSNLKKDYWGTLADWQDRRPIWLLGGGSALALEIFSWAYFQNFLGLSPCEMCVYIRFSMVAIFAGAMIAAIKPNKPLFKAIGYIVVIWGMVKGLRWDIALELDYLKALEDPFSVPCSMATAYYPFGLPLAQWLPGHFAPAAMCGEDGWSLFGLNMAQWLFIVYGVYLLGIFNLLISWPISRFLKKTKS